MRQNKYVTLEDIHFLNTTREQFLNTLKERIQQENKTFVVTANPEILMRTTEDVRYKTAVQKADYVIADGIGVILMSKLKKQPLQERVAGFDVMSDLLQVANERKLNVYLLGAKEPVNQRAAEEIQHTYKHLRIVGRHHGFIRLNDSKVPLDIKEKNPDLVFVALGMPKQELFIEKYLKIFKKGIFIGVGGSFDIFAKQANRAPKLFIKLNLEWLYRMVKEPARLKRNLNVLKFMMTQIGRLKNRE